jgi:hypothetical protein
MNTTGTTFEVSRVRRATEPLPEVPYLQAVGSLLGQPFRREKERLRDHLGWYERHPEAAGGEREVYAKQLRQRQALLEAEEAAATRPFEACSRYHGRLVEGVAAHPVIAALHRAFTQHRPLCLSPDMVWLLLCQGAAHHINLHAEDLRSRLVRHQGAVRIVVRRDDFVKGSPENPWGEVVGEFSARIREHAGPVHDRFVPRFSTTGPAERVAAEIVLLDAVKSYFRYVLDTLCGIPAVTLEGTAEDWQELAERAREFAGFDLGWWLTPLQPILQEFAAAARGRVRRPFWESIYKFGSFSGGGAVTGWIAAFFPYFKGGDGAVTVQNPWLAEGGGKLRALLAGEWDPQRFDLGGPSPGDFPGGLARAPLVWEYLGTSLDMEFLGGFVGVAQDPATLALRPEVGWAIREVGRAGATPA